MGLNLSELLSNTASAKKKFELTWWISNCLTMLWDLLYIWVNSFQARIKKADHYNFTYIGNCCHFETTFEEKPAVENSKITAGAKTAGPTSIALSEFFKLTITLGLKRTLLFTKIDPWEWRTQHANVAWGDRSSSHPQQGGETWGVFVNPAGKFWEQTSRWRKAKEETVH